MRQMATEWGSKTPSSDLTGFLPVFMAAKLGFRRQFEVAIDLGAVEKKQ